MESDYIFVYGTLRKSTATDMFHVLARHCEFVGDGYFCGELYEIDGYPGVVESTRHEDKVVGEVYKIIGKGSVLSALDEYEECSDHFPKPHEYLRLIKPVYLNDGRTIGAWIYLYNLNVSNLTKIESGDYLEFKNSQTGK